MGSGGYNAALIAEIVGPRGLVVTVDIDSFVTERASRFLAQTGYSQVRVVLGDAEHVAEGHAPKAVSTPSWSPWASGTSPGGTCSRQAAGWWCRCGSPQSAGPSPASGTATTSLAWIQRCADSSPAKAPGRSRTRSLSSPAGQ
ncbi:hypothetical protein ABZ912_58900 [Nonomuraea angiospora]|uniref:hypothetical protein n=1 Tax=Nonomuraea angiospora TaxID=46172 RepID=UPI003408A287